MEAASRAALRAFASPAPFLSWAALTGVLAVSGPFGTYDSCTFGVRILCFGTLVGICIVWGVVWRALLQHFWPTLGFFRASTIVVAVSAIVLPGPLIALAPVLTEIPRDGVPSFLETAVLVVAFGTAAALMRRALPGEGVAGRSAQDVPSSLPGLAPPQPRLLRRIDPQAAGAILRLAARDHYVDVVTTRGTSSILMRLTDAIAELDGVSGLRVHRSHWVADTAVRGAEVRGDRLFLILSDGAQVPVARPMMAEAEARGMIPPATCQQERSARPIPEAQRGIGSGRAAEPVRTAMAPESNSDDNAGSELAKPPV